MRASSGALMSARARFYLLLAVLLVAFAVLVDQQDVPGWVQLAIAALFAVGVILATGRRR